MRGNFTSRRTWIVRAAASMSRHAILPVFCTCSFALTSIFRQSLKHRAVRVLGLLLALGCAAVFDGQTRAIARVFSLPPSDSQYLLLRRASCSVNYEGTEVSIDLGGRGAAASSTSFVQDFQLTSAARQEVSKGLVVSREGNDVFVTIIRKGEPIETIQCKRHPYYPPSDPNAGGFAGLFIGGNIAGNFNTLGQTESFAGVVTNRFNDSSNAVGGGVNIGFLSSPWHNNILIGASGSVDFLNHDTIHSFAPGPFFLGQSINRIWTLNGQFGVVAKPGVFLFTEVGAGFVDVTQKLNFLGPVTSVDQTVTGLNLGVGAAFQPPDWQFAGNQVALVLQYNHFFVPVATFNNPGSPGFTYDNRNNIDKFTAGIRVCFVYCGDRATGVSYVLPNFRSFSIPGYGLQ
jgi:opacity protein-like surface antigen